MPKLGIGIRSDLSGFSMKPIALIAIAAAILSTLLGASGIVATRFVIAETQPFTLALIRYGSGLLVLGSILFLTTRVRIPRQDLLPIAILGLLFYGLHPWLFNVALSFTSASRGAMIMSTMPVMTLVLSALLGDDRLSLRKAMGVAGAIGGVAVALGDGASLPNTPNAWLGDLFMGIAIAVGAAYTVLHRRYLLRYPVLSLTVLGMSIGVVVMFAMASLFEGLVTHVPEFSRGGWLALLVIAVLAGVLSPFLWNWALVHISATQVAVCLSLSPLGAILMAAPILGEPITANLLLGVALVVAGIVLANWRPARKDG